jgi:hypothetical protein
MSGFSSHQILSPGLSGAVIRAGNSERFIAMMNSEHMLEQ